MRITRECFEIANPIVARAGTERIAERQCGKCRVAACAATADRNAFRFDAAGACKMAHRIFAILYIDNAPVPIEPHSVRTTKTGGTTVVDIDHRPAATRVVLNTEIDRTLRRRCRAAMTHDEQR